MTHETAILDAAFDEGMPCTATTEIGQNEPATAEQYVYDPHQGTLPGLMVDNGVVLQPFFQQSHRAHAVPSEPNFGVETTIDQLKACISYRNSWGYPSDRT